MMCNWTDTYGEPALEEILNEPIVTALMSSDNVDRRWLEDLLWRKSERENSFERPAFA